MDEDTTVTASDRARYVELMKEIEAAASDEMRGWDRKWEAVDQVLARRLFVLSAERTAERWCKAVVGTSYRNAARNARVARHFSADDERGHPIEKLEALVGRLERQNGGRLPRGFKIRPDSVRIAVRRDGKPRRVGLDEASIAEIRRLPRDVVETSQRTPVEQLFLAALRGAKAPEGITLRVSDGRLWLGSVPLPHLERVLEALGAVDWRAATEVGSKRTPKKTTATTAPAKKVPAKKASRRPPSRRR